MSSFTITLQGAKDIPEEDGVTKNDLYAIITYGDQKVTTEKASDGGLINYKYTWDQTFTFDLTEENELEIRLYDADVGFDDYIGKAKYTLVKTRKLGEDEHEAAVVTKDHVVQGKVFAKLTLVE